MCSFISYDSIRFYAIIVRVVFIPIRRYKQHHHQPAALQLTNACPSPSPLMSFDCLWRLIYFNIILHFGFDLDKYWLIKYLWLLEHVTETIWK